MVVFIREEAYTSLVHYLQVVERTLLKSYNLHEMPINHH